MGLKMVVGLVLVWGVGCGAAHGETETLLGSSSESTGDTARTSDVLHAEPAPWNIAALGQDEVPAPLVTAWEESENRHWCGLVSFEGPDLSSARVTSFDGGWSVEFDGGQANFGLVGTSIDTETEDPGEAEERRFRDGSVLRYEPALGEDEDARVATIRIAGQACLYQVWSMGGDAHLEQLVSSLRRVGSATGTREGQAFANE